MYSSCIGEPAKFEDKIPYSDYTYDDAIESGELIGSNIIGDIYVPFLSEMMILKFLHVYTDSTGNSADTVKLLGDIMDCKKHFTSVKLEQIMYLRERLLSKYRLDDNSKLRSNIHKPVVVKDFFTNGIQSIYGLPALDAFALNVDRSKFSRSKYF